MTNKYLQGKIYKVINTIDDMEYYGSTIQRLCSRIGNHRAKAGPLNKSSKFYSHMRNVGIEFFKIILVHNFPCGSLEELEAEEYRVMNTFDLSKLLNENVVYKKHSIEHNKKVGDAQRGEKHSNWKYGSIFRNNKTSKEGWVLDAWCFAFRCKETEKMDRCSFSIKKHGEDGAKKMAEDKRSEIYPESINI